MSTFVYQRLPNHETVNSNTILSSCLAMGRVLYDGLFSLDEKASDTLTEWKEDKRKSQVTIRQLLSFCSGIDGGDYGTVPSYMRAVSMAMGKGKNRCYDIPSLEMVVIRMGDSEGREFSDNEFLGKLLGAYSAKSMPVTQARTEGVGSAILLKLSIVTRACS
jgi:hypothetical protein